MKIVGEPKAFLSNEALQLLNLYESLGERAEIFLPRHIFDNLTSFVSLCMEEPDDPARQQAEINRYLLKFREDIPGYTDVSLMLIPHNNSKAFELSSKRGEFVKKINSVLDTDGTTTEIKNVLINIRDSHDLSVGTPPINSYHIDFMSQIQQIKKMGNLKELASMIPGVGKAIKDIDIDDNAFKSIEAIIYSMTPEERTHPEILNGTRRTRIAKGSGTSIQEVNRLLKQFDQTRKMMKMVTGSKMAGMMQKMKKK